MKTFGLVLIAIVLGVGGLIAYLVLGKKQAVAAPKVANTAAVSNAPAQAAQINSTSAPASNTFSTALAGLAAGAGVVDAASSIFDDLS